MEQLTAGELEVMQILWERGSLKPSEIQDRYPRPIKNAALRFQLRVLLQKGHVARKKEGRAFVYRAATPKKRAFRTMARRMARYFCSGSAIGLIAELMKAEDLSPKDVEQLKRFAAEGKRPMKEKRKKQ